MRLRQTCKWVLVLGLGLPAGAFAHARLEQAEPAKRAALSAAPTQIRLKFNESVEAGYSRITVEDATGAAIAEGVEPGADARSLELRLPALPPGEYRVRFRALSVDGHVIEADYPFRIKPATP